MPFNPLLEPVDYIMLAAQQSPGLATITGASSPRRWDKRKGYAQTGARVVFRGVDLASFTVTLRLYSDLDWKNWHGWRPLVQRPPVGERARAMDIYHPMLEDLGIKSVVVEDVSQPRQTADGEWSIDIKFIEYRRPLPRVAPIDSSEENRPPLTRLEREIAINDNYIRVLTGIGNGTIDADGAEAQAIYEQQLQALAAE